MFTKRPSRDAESSFIEDELNCLSAHLAVDRPDFKDFWDRVKQLNAIMSSSGVMRGEQGTAVRLRLDEICARAKQRREEAAEQKERRLAISKNKRNLVEAKIHEAHGYARGGRDSDDLKKGRALLQEALEWMKNGWAGFNAPTQLFAFDDGRMTKSDHDACWERWQEANRAIDNRRKELGDYNFSVFESDAENAIGAAEYDPKGAREKVRAIQSRMKGAIMSGEQFERIRYLLDKAWKYADAESDRRKREAIRRKRELIGQVMNQISSIKDQIDHYRGEEASARTGRFREAMQEKIEIRYGWIEQKKSFIRDLENQIDEIHSQLSR